MLLASPDDSGSDTRAFLARETSSALSQIPCLVGAIPVCWAVAGLFDCGVTGRVFSTALRILFGSAACGDCPAAGDGPGDD